MERLRPMSLTEEVIGVAAERMSAMSERLEAIGEAGRIVDKLKEFIDFARDRLSRLDSLMINGVWRNHLMICRLLVKLGYIYFSMPSSSENGTNAISYLSEARELLAQRKDQGMDDVVMWSFLWKCDLCLLQVYTQRGQLDKAIFHSMECVASARQFKVSNQDHPLTLALSLLGGALYRESKYSEALVAAEESYILASKHHSPAHKRVLQASRQMINCLIALKDFSTADAYCRMNYSNLVDPLNAGEYDTEDKINVMSQLVDIWLWKEPDEDEIVEKALADEALDLSRKAYEFVCETPGEQGDCDCQYSFCQVLLKTNQLTEETEGLLHQLTRLYATAIYFNVEDTRRGFRDLSSFYFKLNESLPIGEKDVLVQRNIVLCRRMWLPELESCNDGSIVYLKALEKVIPYFKNNVDKQCL